MVIEKINLDLSLKMLPVTVKAKQGDRESRYIEASLFYNNLAYNIPATATVLISYLKPDKKKVENTVMKENVIGNKVTFSLTEQMLTVAGISKCDVKIINDNGIISTATFKIHVEPQAVPDGAVKSTDEYNALINALEDVRNVEQNYTPKLLEVERKIDSNTSEVITARSSGVKGKTFDVLDERLEEAEQDLISFKEEYATQITALETNKVEKVVGMGLSKNNYDDLEKAEVAKVKEKADKAEVTNCITPRGNSLYSSLPKEGNTIGDYYYCSDGDSTYGKGNYVWNGTSWFFGGTGDEGYYKLKNELQEDNIIRQKKQLYDSSKNISGYHWKVRSDTNTAILNSYEGWFVTEKIKIEKENNYIYTGLLTLGNSPVASFFDSKGDPIVGGYFKAISGENKLINIPQNATSISFSINNKDINTFSFVEEDKLNTVSHKINMLNEDIEIFKNTSVSYESLKALPKPSSKKICIIKSKDGGVLWSDMSVWRWIKDNSLALSSRAYETVKISDNSVVSSYNADVIHPIYSITKLISCVVACMYITDYNAEVTILDSDCGSERSEKIVKPGDTLTYDSLLNSALIQSDNNACNALRRPIGYIINPTAENTGQAKIAFYNKMQEVADSLGMSNTNCDASRISASAGVYSTSSDLCKLISHIRKNVIKICEIWNKINYTMIVTGANARTWDITSTTSVEARALLPEFAGGKTGSSDKMFSYAFVWKDKNDIEYATALLEGILSTGDRFQDARHIIDEVYSLQSQ